MEIGDEGNRTGRKRKGDHDHNDRRDPPERQQQKSEGSRTHCRFPLYEIVRSALDNNSNTPALRWLESGKTFEVNWNKFTNYYQLRGNSSASESNIKNRMTKAKTGFVLLKDTLPTEGYDKVYTHINWGYTQATKGSNNAHPTHHMSPMPPSSVPVTTHHGVPSSVPLPHVNISSNAPPQHPTPMQQMQSAKPFVVSANEENIACAALAQQPNWQSGVFDMNKFIFHLNQITDLGPQYDTNNFRLLLQAEAPNTNLQAFSTKALSDFGFRFGPWSKITERIRNFVKDGARYWFIGLATSSEANQKLYEFQNTNPDRIHYLIRSVPLDTSLLERHTYIFALSYIKPKSQPEHIRIFQDKLWTLGVIQKEIGNNKEIKYFTTFKELIEKYIDIPIAAPIGDQRYQGLVTMQENIKVLNPTKLNQNPAYVDAKAVTPQPAPPPPINLPPTQIPVPFTVDPTTDITYNTYLEDSFPASGFLNF